MATLLQHSVAPVAGAYVISSIEISHSLWGTTYRYVDDVEDRVLLLETGLQYTFTAGGAEARAGGSDDSGLDSRQLRVADPAFALWKSIESVIGEDESIKVTIRLYLSTDPNQPLTVSELDMVSPTRDGIEVSFEVSSAEVVNRDAPTLKFTWENSPGLRGR